MLRFIIDKYTHGFSVRVVFSGDKNIIFTFRATLATYSTKFDWKTKRKVSVFDVSYSVSIDPISTYKFPGEVFDDFIEHLKGYGVSLSEITINIPENVTGKRVYITLTEAVVLREYQPKIIEFMCEPVPIRVLHLQTGKGKTLSTLVAIARLGVRAVGIMASSFIPAWVKDVGWMYTDPACLLVVSNHKALKDLIRDGKRNKIKHAIIIISLGVLRSYFTEYETTGESTYGCEPADLFRIINAGIRFTDEAHKDLHFQFRVNCLTNVHRAFYLTATINSKDPAKNKMYKLIFPIKHRYAGLAWDKYIDVVAISYTLEKPLVAKYSSSLGYSHVIYEQYLMSSKDAIKSYLKMINAIVNQYLKTRYVSGMKMLIYAATKEMCDLIAIGMKDHENIGQYTIASFNDTDPEEILHTHDFVVTTIQKAGTGKDVDKLVDVLCTVAMDTYEGNTQVLGRLRPITKHYPDMSPVFTYIVCLDIQKHVDYHHSKVKLFTPLTKSIVCLRSHFRV